MASYTLHLVSGPPGTNTMDFSILIGAGTAVKNHTVPANESSSSLMVTEAAYTFLQDHSDVVLNDVSARNPFLLQLYSDSKGHLKNLRTNKEFNPIQVGL